MRVGVGVGPFYASTSTRRRRGEVGCFPVFMIAVAVATAVTFWRELLAFVIVFAVLLTPVLVTRAVLRRRGIENWFTRGRRR
jgi:hypothetical protein